MLCLDGILRLPIRTVAVRAGRPHEHNRRRTDAGREMYRPGIAAHNGLHVPQDMGQLLQARTADNVDRRYLIVT